MIPTLDTNVKNDNCYLNDKESQSSSSSSRSCSGDAGSVFNEKQLEKSSKHDAIKPAASIIYLMSILSAMGGFLFGYDTGIVSGAMVFVRETFNLNNIWQELVVSITLLSAWAFSLMAGSMSDHYGRKKIIIVASLFFAVGSLIMGTAWSKWPLLIGRLIVGVAIGLSSAVVPMYIAEVSPSELRGSLVTLHNCCVCFGQLCAAIVAGIFSFDHVSGWRWMLSLAALPALVQFVGFSFMPESPRWLLEQGRHDEAKKALLRIRGGQADSIQLEFSKMDLGSTDDDNDKQRGNNNILVAILRNRGTRQALFVGCLLAALQQLCGINTVMYYTATIIEMSGVASPSTAIWLTVPTATVLMIFSMVGFFLADKVNRRTLTLSSLFGVAIALALLATGFYLNVAIEAGETNIHHQSETCYANLKCQECLANQRCGFCYYLDELDTMKGFCLVLRYRNGSFNSLIASDGTCSKQTLNTTLVNFDSGDCLPFDTSQSHISVNTWLVFAGLILYLAAFAPGMGPMPWTINSEIYPMWARGVCYSIATSVIWMFNTIISFTFLTLTEALTTHGTFYMYSAIVSIGWLLLYWKLPETRGKSLEEVSSLFEKKATKEPSIKSEIR